MGDATPARIIDEIPTICPECGLQTRALLVERDGGVFQAPRCARHGALPETRIFSDAAFYRSLEAWNHLILDRIAGAARASSGSSNGRTESEYGLFSRNAPSLAVIDITNRCNFKCPLCFAETNGVGDHYFLGREQIAEMLGSLLRLAPTPCRQIQFSGGEPTLHPEFPEIVRMARDMGFTHVQVATNGSRFADPEYVAQCGEAGLHTLYLQFDGMNDDVYLKLRGRRLLDQKIRIISNIARTNLRVVLVPTIFSGVNVDQLGPIFEFALAHSRHVTGISVQPAAHVGRVEVSSESDGGFDLARMAMEFSSQTGLARYPEDWFPLAAISLLTRGISNARREALPSPACDAHCSLGTYFYIDDEDKPHCVSQFFDVARFFERMADVAPGPDAGVLHRRISQLRGLRLLADCFDERKAPKGLTFERLLCGLDGWEDKSCGRAPDWAERGFNGMFFAGMHFMDSRNYNFHRLERCIVQYVTTDSRIVPFCSYNAGARLRAVEEAARKAHALSTGTGRQASASTQF